MSSIFQKIAAIAVTVGHAIGEAGSAVGKWVAGAWNWVETDGAKIAVAIVNEFESLVANGSLGFLAAIADQLTKSQIPTEILDDLKVQLPKALAIALAIEGLPANPTQQDIEDFENRVLAAFGVTDSKSRIYTTVGAYLIATIRNRTQAGQTYTFAELVTDLEGAWQTYQNAKAEDTTE